MADDVAVKLATPYEIKFSQKIMARYGFKDARGEVVIELPFPLSTVKKTYTENLTLKELKALKEAVDKAVMWGELPDYQRERDGAV